MKNVNYFYNPEFWLETSTRALEEYIQRGFDEMIAPSLGDHFFEVMLGYPEAGLINRLMPFRRTLVHIEIDDIDNRLLGFGDNIGRDNYDANTGLLQLQEAGEHRIDFDIGVWTDDAAGGTTARLRAYQMLNILLQGAMATRSLFDASTNGDGGVEIIEFQGGRFIVERVNDLPVYRIVACTLTVRVFSRSPLVISPQEPAIQEILIRQNLTITP